MNESEADSPRTASDEASTEAEGTGETVGEAKWSALRELERRFPGIDRSRVEFEVLAEGERGLLGVGFVPAHVIARVAGSPSPAIVGEREADSETAGRLRAFLELVRTALGLDVSLTLREDERSVTAVFHGRDLGLVIGKHGQTIDAIQYLATVAVLRGTDEVRELVIDATGYRDRRRAALESIADRAARRAVATEKAVALEPMTPSERKVVHLYLKERQDVVTVSEGSEPNRRVIVRPRG